MIPNTVHFIYLHGPDARPFSYLNYLAVRTAAVVQEPDMLVLHHNEQPVNNRHWDMARELATPRQVEAPTHIGGIPLKYPQYQADVLRLRVLYEEGGIYLDTDELLLRPLTPLLANEMVLGGESYPNEAVGSNNAAKVSSVANCAILASKKHRFLARWLDATPEALTRDVWAFHAVHTPMELLAQDSSDVTLLPTEAFCPFSFRDEWIFGSDVSDLDKLEHSYALHMWETWWTNCPWWPILNEKYLCTSDSLLARVVPTGALDMGTE